MRLALLETQNSGFLASWPRISTALGQILQGQKIIIFKTKKMRRLFVRYGPRREKTCGRGLRKSETQTSLHSYRDWLENRNFACSKLIYGAFPKNYKGADQTTRMRSLVCIFFSQTSQDRFSRAQGHLLTGVTSFGCALYRLIHKWELSGRVLG